MKLKNIILLGTVTLAFTACDDLFEPALENNADLSRMNNDPEFARGIIDNAFLVIPLEASGIASEQNGGTTDVATDDAVSNNTSNNYKKMATGSWTSQNNPINQWEGRYHAIQYCNLFLSKCDDVLWDYSTEALNQMHRDLYKGNAYALRGLHFFHLLRAHVGKVNGEIMGLPIHVEPEDGTSDFNLPRNTFKECIDQIMSDFDEALKYLPLEYGDVNAGGVPAKYVQIGGKDEEYNRAFGDLQKGKIDGRNIAAFKAQVAIFAASPAYQSAGAMSWEKAAEYAATSLKNVGGLDGMDPDGWHWYNNTDMIESYKFSDPDPLEVCFRGNIGESYSLEQDQYPPSLNGNGRLNPTQNLVDAFPMANGLPITDPNSGYDPQNPYANRDPRLDLYIIHDGSKFKGATITTAVDGTDNNAMGKFEGQSTRTGYYLKKLLVEDVNCNPTSKAAQTHIKPWIRYTEIFLNYAEAANEAWGPKNGGSNGFSAYDVIKAIRQRAGVGGDDDKYLEECAESKDKMRELIRNERRLELCFEDFRFWDLRRWKVDLNKLNETVKGMRIEGGKYQVVDVETRKYSDYMYYGPVPYSEILKFNQLKQNKGW